MLLEHFDWGLEARSLHIIAALLIGLAFGAAAQVTRFCLRRAVVGEAETRVSASAVWITAFAVAVAAFQLASFQGLIDLQGHRYLATDIPVLAIALGGLLFGVGMVLANGCASRLSVLAASGNLRAVSVLIVFAIVAHATLKGVLAPLRTTLGALTIELPFGALTQLPFAGPVGAVGLLMLAVVLVRRSGVRAAHVALAVLIGLVPVAGWMATSTLLFDEFEPLAVQSAAFTLSWSDTLFWGIASTAVPAGFGTGFLGGVLIGSALSALARGEFTLASFENPNQTLRYLAGGILMGFGGVLAGGCTVGAGLSGGAALSLSALLALFSIIAGALLAKGFAARQPVALRA